MSRPRGRRPPAGLAGVAGALLLALLAAGCAEQEPADRHAEQPKVGAEEQPAAAPSSGSILGVPAADLMAEVEPGTGHVAIVRKPPRPALGLEPLAPEAGAGPAEGQPARGEAAGSGRNPNDAEADRELAETRSNLGAALEAAGDVEGAVSEFEASLAYPWPGRTAETPLADLARICRRGEPAAAVARACTRVLNVLRFSPSELAEFLANRGDAHVKLGRADLALSDYRAALEIESSNFAALVGRARLNLSEGRPAAALNDLRLAISTGPRPAEARMVRVRALRALGRLEAAVADYDAVLADERAKPWHIPAWRGRAETHCALGRADAAAVDWQVWADSVPGGPVYVQEMLHGRGYLRGRPEPGIGPVTLAGLRAWTREGCP